MHDESKKGMIWWVLAGLLVLGIIGAGIMGAVKISDWKRATIWEVEAGEMSLTPVEFEDGLIGYDYYKLEFKLTNNSSEDLESVPYRFDAYVARDEKRGGARIVSQQRDDGVVLYNESCVPSGCTGNIELYLEIDPERIKNEKLEIKLDPYSEGAKVLGTVKVP